MQELEVLFQNRNYTISYSPQYKLLVMTPKGVPSFEIVKEAWLEMLQIAMKYRIDKWLSNEEELIILPIEGLDWFKNHWFPLAIEKLTHVKRPYVATVLSERFYAECASKMSINAMHQSQEQKFGKTTMTSKLFKSYQEAWHWITTVDA